MSGKRAITLIGSGNVAWQLGLGLAKAGHQMEAVYSRKIENAKALASLFPHCIATDQLDFSKSRSEIFLMAISDQVLGEMAEKMIVPEKAIVAHTSGSVSMEALRKFSSHGVFYPLQTFTKGREMKLSEIPFGIEASDENVYKQLTALAHSLSDHVQKISSEQRKIIHVAAVFACNFTNHLFSISEEILKKENLDFNLLKPLIRETIEKAFVTGPQKAQTGPAIRGDEKIIHQHLEYLQDEPELQQLYKFLSERIQRSKEVEKKKKD